MTSGAKCTGRLFRIDIGSRAIRSPSEGQIFESIQNLIYPVVVATDPSDLLRQRGIQVTAQRLAVLRAVAGQPHISADGVAEVVRAEIGAISLQSVYDALGLLLAEGLIRRIQPAGSPARYENRVGDNHHHLVCRICGRLVDVDCAVGSAPCLTAVDDRGYEVDEAEVAYWGRCPDCLAQSQASARSDPPARRRRTHNHAATPRE
ncbi:MAG: transcriptional repressor [Acidobacteria bacterium]|nr:transcriptional repressor [Acidobacteriota bacterium]